MILLVLACAADEALPYGAAAEDCAMCHVEEAEAWAASGHATSGTSPVFRALLGRVEAAWGEVSAQACTTCHQPGWGGDAGIGCVSCHAAVGDHGAHDGRLAVDLDAPLAGPLGGGGVVTAAHTSTGRGYLTEAALCGACHEVTGPRLFVEGTLSENAAAGGDTCVMCHAAPIEDGPLTPGTPPRPRHDHRYVGVSPTGGGGRGDGRRVGGGGGRAGRGRAGAAGGRGRGGAHQRRGRPRGAHRGRLPAVRARRGGARRRDRGDADRARG